MNSSPLRDLMLAKLEEGTPGVTEAWGKFLAEATTVCFECQNHATGVELTVKGFTTTTFKVHWEKDITDQVLNSWDDPQDATEFGACGVAILLILELTRYTVIRKARKGTGVDYWLGFKDASMPFQDVARLEVSGIMTGDDQVVKSRIKKKKNQTKPTDSGNLPAYIVVVEFGKPVSHVVKK